MDHLSIICVIVFAAVSLFIIYLMTLPCGSSAVVVTSGAAQGAEGGAEAPVGAALAEAEEEEEAVGEPEVAAEEPEVAEPVMGAAVGAATAEEEAETADSSLSRAIAFAEGSRHRGAPSQQGSEVQKLLDLNARAARGDQGAAAELEGRLSNSVAGGSLAQAQQGDEDGIAAGLPLTEREAELLKRAVARRAPPAFFENESKEVTAAKSARAQQWRELARDNPDSAAAIYDAVGLDGVRLPTQVAMRAAMAHMRHAGYNDTLPSPVGGVRRRRPASETPAFVAPLSASQL